MTPGIDYFPSTYRASRKLFLESPQGLERRIEYCTYPLGHDGLSVDVAVTDDIRKSGGRPKNLVVLVSGTHGIEGYAGAAIQMKVKDELLRMFDKNATVALIHALNPYGMHNEARTNENNVDLNRNMCVSPDGYSTGDTQIDEVCASMQSVLNPDRPRKAELSEIFRFYKAFAYPLLLNKFGYSKLYNLRKQVIAGGQYMHPRSLFYGGKEPEKSTLILRDIIAKLAPGHENILFIDLHTGLGNKGAHNYATLSPESSESFKRLKKAVPQLVSLAESDSGNVYKMKGSTLEYVPNFIGDANFYGLMIDFWTIGEVQVLYRMIAENQTRNRKDTPSDVRARAHKRFIEAFYPSDSPWRVNVMSEFEKVFARLGQEFKLFRR